MFRGDGTKELIAGYTLIQVKSNAEAMEWARRFPAPHGDADGEMEIRQLYELEDFAAAITPEAQATFDRVQEKLDKR